MLCQVADGAAAAAMLCDLAHHAREQDADLHWFRTVPLGKGVAPGSPLTSLLLTMHWFGESRFFTAKIDGERVDVFHVVPITEEERQLGADLSLLAGDPRGHALRRPPGPG
jgi:hypothetical protein